MKFCEYKFDDLPRVTAVNKNIIFLGYDNCNTGRTGHIVIFAKTGTKFTVSLDKGLSDGGFDLFFFVVRVTYSLNKSV